MTGRNVFHDIFGVGTIVSKVGNLLTVDFKGDEKKFVYPDAFEKYLSSADQELMAQVNRDIQAKRTAHAEDTRWAGLCLLREPYAS